MSNTSSTVRTTAIQKARQPNVSDFGKGFYLPSNSKDGGLLYDVQVANQRYQGSTGTKDPAEARAIVAEVRARAPKERASADAAQMTWIQGVSKYMKDKGDATSTAAMARESLHLLTVRIGPNTKLRDIDDDLLVDLIAERKEDYRWDDPKGGKVSGARVNRSVTDLVKRVLTHARKRYKVLLPNEPDYAEYAECEEIRVRELSDHEEALLRSDERDDLMEFVDFLLLTGLRYSAALIRWDQVLTREGVIRVKRLKRKKRKKVLTSEYQEIPITARLAALLEAQRGRDKTFVFTYRATKTQRIARTTRKMVKGQRYPLTYQGFSSSWEDLCGRHGIEDLHIHDLRKTAGSRMLRATGNIAVVSEFLGHSDIRMTKRYYAHVASDDIRTAMETTEQRYYGEVATHSASANGPPSTRVCTCSAGMPAFPIGSALTSAST